MISNITFKDKKATGGNWRQNKRTSAVSIGAIVLFLLLALGSISNSAGSASAQTPAAKSNQQAKTNSGNEKGIGDNLLLDKLSLNTKGGPALSATLPNTTNTAASCGPGWTLVQSDNATASISGFVDMDGISSTDVWGVGVYQVAGNPNYTYTLTEHWNGTSWSVVPSPSAPTAYFSALSSVAAVSNTDAWAVGYYTDPNTTNYRTLIERWNGTTWNIVPSPNATADDTTLKSVVAVNANNVWAFGYSTDNYQRTLIEHWDGVSWSILPSPNIGALSNRLEKGSLVPGSNGTDIWAVGTYIDINNGSIPRTLAMRWNGTSWNIVTTPNIGNADNGFLGVTAISATDAWAVGGASVSGVTKTLTAHWDGVTWSVVTSPSTPNVTSYLSDVEAESSGNVWAVGNSQGAATQSVILHWSGSSWTTVPANAPGFASALVTITILSNSDMWAGYVYSSGSVTTDYPFADHFDGANWTPVFAPPGPTNVNILSAVSADAAGNVWAVGYYRVTGNGFPSYNQTLIEKWNGSTWNLVTSSNQSATTNNDLEGIAMVPGNANDGWAVGSYIDPVTHKGRTLIERWNGSAWGTIFSPNVGNFDNQLTNVTVASADNVWAVGYYTDGTTYSTLIEHWNGTAWSVITSPNASPGTSSNYLFDVVTVPGTLGADVWAVGYTSGATYETLTMKWNAAGNTWNIIPSPSGPNNNGFLFGVSAVTSSDVWAVGYSNGSGHHTSLTEHWNGTSWTVIPSADFGSTGTDLRDIIAIANDDIYAVGSAYVGASTIGPAIEHWNGNDWSLLTSPDPSPTEAVLFGVAAVSSTDVWAVGYTSPELASNNQALIERFHPCPASCNISFNDVPSGSTFAPYVQCLACQNIVGGYNCGGAGEPCPGMYFRPTNNVTRGQAAKFIANAAGYADVIPANRQTFADISSASPFWVYVERVYQHGAISGYPCGGPGEPCPGTYFRPGANLTRGQLAKISTTAAGFNDTPVGQTFIDVAPASSFYLYVERAYIHAIISGYACGGPGEPCPGSYFRPGLNVTRGQTSKIVSGTFFPSCGTDASKR